MPDYVFINNSYFRHLRNPMESTAQSEFRTLSQSPRSWVLKPQGAGPECMSPPDCAAGGLAGEISKGSTRELPRPASSSNTTAGRSVRIPARPGDDPTPCQAEWFWFDTSKRSNTTHGRGQVQREMPASDTRWALILVPPMRL